MKDDKQNLVDEFLTGTYQETWQSRLSPGEPGPEWTHKVKAAVCAAPLSGATSGPLATPSQPASRPFGFRAPAWGRWAVGTALALALVVGTLPSWYVPAGLAPAPGDNVQVRGPGGKSDDDHFGVQPQHVDLRNPGPVHPGPPKHPLIPAVDARLSAEDGILSLTIKNVSSETLLVTPPQTVYVAGYGTTEAKRVESPSGWGTQPIPWEPGAERTLSTVISLPTAPGWYETGLVDRVTFAPLADKQKSVEPTTATPGTTERIQSGGIGPGATRVFVAPAPGQAVNGKVTAVGESSRDGFTLVVDRVTFADEYTTVAFTVKGNIPVPTSFGFGLQRAGRSGLEGALELEYKGVNGGLTGIAKFGPTLKGEAGSLQVVLKDVTTYGPTEIAGPWTVEVPVK